MSTLAKRPLLRRRHSVQFDERASRNYAGSLGSAQPEEQSQRGLPRADSSRNDTKFVLKEDQASDLAKSVPLGDVRTTTRSAQTQERIQRNYTRHGYEALPRLTRGQSVPIALTPFAGQERTFMNPVMGQAVPPPRVQRIMEEPRKRCRHSEPSTHPFSEEDLEFLRAPEPSPDSPYATAPSALTALPQANSHEDGVFNFVKERPKYYIPDEDKANIHFRFYHWNPFSSTSGRSPKEKHFDLAEGMPSTAVCHALRVGPMTDEMQADVDRERQAVIAWRERGEDRPEDDEKKKKLSDEQKTTEAGNRRERRSLSCGHRRRRHSDFISASNRPIPPCIHIPHPPPSDAPLSRRFSLPSIPPYKSWHPSLSKLVMAKGSQSAQANLEEWSLRSSPTRSLETPPSDLWAFSSVGSTELPTIYRGSDSSESSLEIPVKYEGPRHFGKLMESEMVKRSIRKVFRLLAKRFRVAALIYVFKHGDVNGLLTEMDEAVNYEYELENLHSGIKSRQEERLKKITYFIEKNTAEWLAELTAALTRRVNDPVVIRGDGGYSAQEPLAFLSYLQMKFCQITAKDLNVLKKLGKEHVQGSQFRETYNEDLAFLGTARCITYLEETAGTLKSLYTNHWAEIVRAAKPTYINDGHICTAVQALNNGQSCTLPFTPWRQLKEEFMELSYRQPPRALVRTRVDFSFPPKWKIKGLFPMTLEQEPGKCKPISFLCREVALRGCPIHLRGAVWAHLMATEPLTDEHAKAKLEEIKPNGAAKLHLALNAIIEMEVAEVCSTGSIYEPMRNELKELMETFLLDSWVCLHLPVSEPKSLLAETRPEKHDERRRSSDVPLQPKKPLQEYPPCGVIPRKNFLYYAAPFSLVYRDFPQMYLNFRQMYVRHFHHLAALSSDQQGLLSLMNLFESLLARRSPFLYHEILKSEYPLFKLPLAWVSTAYAKVLSFDQLLILWDLMIGVASTEILVVLALAVFHKEEFFLAQMISDELSVSSDRGQEFDETVEQFLERKLRQGDIVDLIKDYLDIN